MSNPVVRGNEAVASFVFGSQGKTVSQNLGEGVEAVSSGSDPLYAPILAKLPPESKISDFVTSVVVTAHKPSGKSCC